MFESASTLNLVINEDLAVRYDVNPAYDGSLLIGYDVTRVATKSYSYVGMTRAAAAAAVAEKYRFYTRDYYVVEGDSSRTLKKCYANIVSRRVEGRMYQVDISINERDVRRVSSVPGDLDSLFPTRSYDEDPQYSGLYLSGVTKDGGSFTVTYAIRSGFIREEDTSIEMNWGGTEEWQTVARGLSYGRTYNWPSGATGHVSVRLRYGAVLSNVYEMVNV